jgi:hypothetical protein
METLTSYMRRINDVVNDLIMADARITDTTDPELQALNNKVIDKLMEVTCDTVEVVRYVEGHRQVNDQLMMAFVDTDNSRMG